jgi:hypothetical protein
MDGYLQLGGGAFAVEAGDGGLLGARLRADGQCNSSLMGA